MFVECKVKECDFTGKEYPEYVAGAGPIVRGATGRWCVVMWAGPEYLKEHPEIKVHTYEEGLAYVEESGGYADF